MTFKKEQDNKSCLVDDVGARERQILLGSALRLLARREHSQYELKTKLLLRAQRYSISKTHIDPVLEQLIAEGLLDESRFTKSYVRLSLEKGWGKIKIVYYLRRKGISDEDTDACLSEYDEVFWTERAYILLKRKYGKVATDPAAKAGQQRFLMGRGFSYEQIKNAMKRVATEQH